MRERREVHPRIRETTPFVARRLELDWLERCSRQSFQGRPRICLISGDAGIGKTRLVRELAANARRGRVSVCYGRGRDGFPVSYLPFEPLLDELSRSAEEDARTRGAVEALGRLLGYERSAVQEGSELEGFDAEAERRRTFHAIARGLFPHARRGPLLLALEDLHCWDAPSLDLLAHVAFAAADASASDPLPLLVVCTFRPPEPESELARFVARFQREEICESLELAGFDSLELGEMIDALGIHDPSRHLLRRTLDVTGGNPLFVEEVIVHLRRQGALVDRAGRWETTLDPDGLALPAILSEAIAARIDDLDAECRRALTLAAFLADPFDAADLADLGGLGREELDAWLLQARSARLVTSSNGRHHFSHPLTRQAFRSRPEADERQDLHRRIALWIESHHADELEPHIMPLADHWLCGMRPGDEARVLERARAAGDHAMRVFDWPRATEFYGSALSVGESAGLLSAAERADLHHRMGTSEFRHMDADASLEHHARAVELHEASGDVAGRARSQLASARTHLTLRSTAYGSLIDVKPLERSLEDLGDGEAELRGYLCATLCEAYTIAKESDKAERFGRRALEIAADVGDGRLAAHAGVSLGIFHQQGLRMREALGSYDDALASARRCGETWLEGWALQRLPLALAWLGELDRASARQAEAADIARRISDWGDYSLALGCRTAIAAARGDFEDVEQSARETLTLVRRTGYPWGGAIALTALAGARALRGEWTEASDAMTLLTEPGVVFAEPGPEMQFLGAIGRLRTRALSGEVDAATRDEATRMLALARVAGVDIGTLAAFCSFVEIGHLAGDADLAEASLPALEAAAERGIVFTAGCEFLVPRVLGVAALLLDREREAEQHLRGAIEQARRVGADPDLARSAIGLAELLAGRGDAGARREAEALLSLADDIVWRRGMKPWTERVRRLGEKLDLPLGRRHVPDAEGALDSRESEILECVARGLTDVEVSEALLLTRETISAHRRSIFDKIGVDGPTGAAAWAYGEGLGADERGGEAARRQVLWVSDIVDSTQLLERLGDAEARQVVRTHNRVIRAHVSAHRGEEIQHTGDGMIVAFDRADPALGCAAAVQRSLAEHNRKHPHTPIRVRIGVHVGRALPEEGRLFGKSVHSAFRICERAEAGQILLSREVYDDCGEASHELHDLGPATLRGLSVPVQLYRLDWDGAPA